jgi:hypothetical protein
VEPRKHIDYAKKFRTFIGNTQSQQATVSDISDVTTAAAEAKKLIDGKKGELDLTSAATIG